MERRLHRRLLYPRPAALAAQRGGCAIAATTSCIGKISIPQGRRRLGRALAERLLAEKAILGVFDEGCMGMFNAIIPDDLLHATGAYKERLSQSALYYETTQVNDSEAAAVRRWMEERGMRFVTGQREEDELTDRQIHQQCKIYIAAVRIADDFGCHAIGIQYQQGLKDLLPASDLVEGTLNNADRPPVTSRDGAQILYAGQPLPHFNEVDEWQVWTPCSPTASTTPWGSRSKTRCTTSAGETATARARSTITCGCF